MRPRQSANYDLRAIISHELEADSLEVAESDKGVYSLNPPSVNSHSIIAADLDKGAPTANSPTANSPTINPHKSYGLVGNELAAKSESLVEMIMGGSDIPEFWKNDDTERAFNANDNDDAERAYNDHTMTLQ